SSRRRHTRSLRDWSSDVCSSDLDAQTQLTLSPFTHQRPAQPALGERRKSQLRLRIGHRLGLEVRLSGWVQCYSLGGKPFYTAIRSEERRVGKECRSWSEQNQSTK